jgi:hypothetical protein
MTKADDETIRQEAYHLWEQAGRPEGREHEFWATAETRLQEKARKHKKPEHKIDKTSEDSFPASDPVNHM